MVLWVIAMASSRMRTMSTMGGMGGQGEFAGCRAPILEHQMRENK